MKACVTVDMDNYRQYRTLIDPGGDADGPSFYQAVPRFLDVFERHGLRATFFVIGRDVEQTEHRTLLREMVARGHELANHSWSHPYNFRQLGSAEKKAEIVRSEEAIADAVGERPVGFRTPSGDVDAETLALLAERGYLYDSSVIPSPLLWVFMLYGKLFVRHQSYQLGSPWFVFAPARPYFPRRDRIYRPRSGADGPGVVEIPLSMVPLVRLPFYATLMRMLGPRFFDMCVRIYGRRPLLHVMFHAIDLIDLTGTSLHAAIRRTPGLDVPFPRRERFVSHVVERLAGIAEGVPLREVARDLHAHGAQGIRADGAEGIHAHGSGS
jgi:hypothetical protein